MKHNIERRDSAVTTDDVREEMRHLILSSWRFMPFRHAMVYVSPAAQDALRQEDATGFVYRPYDVRTNADPRLSGLDMRLQVQL